MNDQNTNEKWGSIEEALYKAFFCVKLVGA